MKYPLSSILTRTFAAGLFLLLQGTVFGQATPAVEQAAPSIFANPVFDLMFAFVLILFFVILSMSGVIRHLLNAGMRQMPNGNPRLPLLGMLLVLSLTAVDANAQAAQDPAAVNAILGIPEQVAGMDRWIFVGLAFLLFAELVIICMLALTIKRILLGLGFKPEAEEKEKKSRFNWSFINRKLTDTVPLEQEASILTDHNYDGIRELDNNLPPWWKYGFYISIVFAVVYLFSYHVLHISPLSIEEYQGEIAAAEIQKKARFKELAANVDETTVKELKDESSLQSGKDIFLESCVACHGKLGEGGVGPNLTDDKWLHGGGIKNIFKTVKYGVPAKGMIAWQSQLPPESIQKVSSYILSLQGSNPPNAKAPQGEPWQEAAAEAVDSTAK